MKEITLKLNDAHIQQIGTALGKEPYIEVFELINELNTQVNEQINTDSSEDFTTDTRRTDNTSASMLE